MNTSRLAALFLLAIVIATARAERLEPKNIGSATAEVSIIWSLDLQGQKLTELGIQTFGFQDYPSQELISEITSPASRAEIDSKGNKLRIFEPALRDYQQLTMNSEMEVGFGFDFPNAAGFDSYLGESEYVQITPEIKEKATQLSAQFGKRIEKAVAISQWVHNNVKYDRDYIDLRKGSRDTFIERAGTCDEFSHLYIAMLRSIGIPAKFSASFVYSGDEWGPHAFVEAEIEGEWVPFDPTFNEAILLDATHIKFGEGLDQGDITEHITAKGYGTDVSKIILTRQFEVEFKETRNFPKLFEMELILPQNTVGEGSLESVKVAIRNGQKRIAIPLSISIPNEAKVTGENRFNEDKLLLLEPYETKEAEWKVIFPDLEEGFDYKFPVSVQSLGQEAKGMILASKYGNTVQEEELLITDVRTADLGGALRITATLKNSGNLRSEGVISLAIGDEKQDRAFFIEPGSESVFEFTVPKPDSEMLEGEFLIESQGSAITQPFSIGLEPSIEPTEKGPSPTRTLTSRTKSVLEGISDEIVFGAFGLLLLFAVYMSTSRIGKHR